MMRAWWLLVAVAIVLALVGSTEAKRCRLRTKNEVWKHSQGKFANEPAGSETWLEYDKDGKVAATFKLQQHAGSQVVLVDPKRNLNILLQDDLCATNQNGGSQYQQLYQGEWSKIVDCV